MTKIPYKHRSMSLQDCTKLNTINVAALKIADEVSERWREEYGMPESDDIIEALQGMQGQKSVTTQMNKRLRAVSITHDAKRGRKK